MAFFRREDPDRSRTYPAPLRSRSESRAPDPATRGTLLAATSLVGRKETSPASLGSSWTMPARTTLDNVGAARITSHVDDAGVGAWADRSRVERRGYARDGGRLLPRHRRHPSEPRQPHRQSDGQSQEDDDDGGNGQPLESAFGPSRSPRWRPMSAGWRWPEPSTTCRSPGRSSEASTPCRTPGPSFEQSMACQTPGPSVEASTTCQTPGPSFRAPARQAWWWWQAWRLWQAWHSRPARQSRAARWPRRALARRPRQASPAQRHRGPSARMAGRRRRHPRSRSSRQLRRSLAAR